MKAHEVACGGSRNSRSIRWTSFALSLVLLAAAAACVPAPASNQSESANPGFDAYKWSQLADGAPWGGRAGAEAVYLDGSFYLLGGRTPNRPTPFPEGPIPGDSKIWGDVWRSDDSGKTWTEVLGTNDSDHWPARSYHEVVVQNSKMILLGGQNFILQPNPACAQNIFCFPRFVSRSDFFNDVWSSSDGANWAQLTAHAPWAARAGAAVVVKDGYLYVLGGENGFTGNPPPYFNDVWRTRNGSDWELVTSAAGWSPRPGHTCDVLESKIVCFGGYGLSPFPLDIFGRLSPTDQWSSEDGATWERETGSPWNARSKDAIRYDYDTVVAPAGDGSTSDAILAFGGDRETFNFFDSTQWRNVDDDVWQFALQP